jgi:hypothetical protein
MRDVELRACQYPEIKTELETLQRAFEQLAMQHALMPRPEVKERIMRAIEEGSGFYKTFPGKSIKDSGSNDENQETKIRPIYAPKSNYSNLMIAAGVALLGVLTALTFYFRSQYDEAKSQVAQMKAQQFEIQKQVDNMQLSMMQNAEKIQLLRDTNTMRIMMKGTEKSPSSIAMIYWNKNTKDVYLDIKALPPIPADKQYQLWFIDPKKGPVSAGVFDLNTGELMKMGTAPDAAAFAVTLEPRGGSVNPTMDQMLVLGTVNS